MIQRFGVFATTISSIYRSMQHIKNQKMAVLGLKGHYLMCLYHLYQNPEGLTSAQLANLCEEDKAAISRTLSDLEKNGLIYKDQGKTQSRYRALIKLTAAGQEITQTIAQKIIESVQDATQGYSEEERKIFYRVLTRIDENLQKAASSEEEKI